MDDVVFLHNGANGLNLKTTCMLCPVRQMAAPVGCQKMLFDRVRQGVTAGVKSAICDYMLQLDI